MRGLWGRWWIRAPTLSAMIVAGMAALAALGNLQDATFTADAEIIPIALGYIVIELWNLVRRRPLPVGAYACYIFGCVAAFLLLSPVAKTINIVGHMSIYSWFAERVLPLFTSVMLAGALPAAIYTYVSRRWRKPPPEVNAADYF